MGKDKEDILSILPGLLSTHKSPSLQGKHIRIIRRIVPDRFLRRLGDPEHGYITAERLNKEFKILEERVAELEEILKNA